MGGGSTHPRGASPGWSSRTLLSPGGRCCASLFKLTMAKLRLPGFTAALSEMPGWEVSVLFLIHTRCLPPSGLLQGAGTPEAPCGPASGDRCSAARVSAAGKGRPEVWSSQRRLFWVTWASGLQASPPERASRPG